MLINKLSQNQIKDISWKERIWSNIQSLFQICLCPSFYCYHFKYSNTKD